MLLLEMISPGRKMYNFFFLFQVFYGHKTNDSTYLYAADTADALKQFLLDFFTPVTFLLL